MAEVSTEFPTKIARKIVLKGAEGRPGKKARCLELREVWRRKCKKWKTLPQAWLLGTMQGARAKTIFSSEDQNICGWGTHHAPGHLKIRPQELLYRSDISLKQNTIIEVNIL